jgi:hypothetical protein
LFPDKNQSVNVASKLKLLNVNAAAQLTIPGYTGELKSVFLCEYKTWFGLQSLVDFSQMLNYEPVT